MKESVQTFGPQKGTVGILSEPHPETQGPNQPAIILLNAGLVHRTGPFRMYVDLARSLTTKGFTVFRIDLSGLGDSLVRKDNRSDEERAIVDVQEAMDLLTEKKNIREFVLLGLCEGADRAHPLGVMDSRVKGIVYLDGYGYKTPGFYIYYPWDVVLHFTQRLMLLEKWKNLVRRCFPWFFQNKIQENTENPSAPYVRETPEKKQFESDLKSMLDRDARLLFVYTDGNGYYNHKGQFREAFKSLCSTNKLQVRFFKKTDHLFTNLIHRDELFLSIGDWMQDHFQTTGNKTEGSGEKLVEVNGS